MNRPSKREYWRIETEEILDIDEYNDDLEKYCDELEKALDKSCELIAKHYWGHGAKKWVADQWKEWLMKDE